MSRANVIEHTIPLYDDICMVVYEVEYVYRWGDGCTSQTLMRSYGVYERREVADYVAKCIDDGIITV